MKKSYKSSEQRQWEKVGEMKETRSYGNVVKEGDEECIVEEIESQVFWRKLEFLWKDRGSGNTLSHQEIPL